MILTIVFFLTLHFVLGAISGWKYREYVAHKKVIQIQQQLEELMDRMVIPIYMKTIDNQVYLYNYDTNQFLAQGVNITDATNKLIDRFPNKLFIPKVNGEYE